MKTFHFIKVLFLLFWTLGTLQAQDVIYTEDFNDDVGKGNDGGIVDLSGVNWTLNTDDCTIASGDYVKVVSTGNDRLEAVDCDGEAIWRSPGFDISNYTDLSISVLTAETGSGSTANNKYVRLYYILDGGSEVSFFESTVNWSSTVATINNLNGTNLQLIARMKTTYASDKIYIDDIVITGTAKSISKDELTQVLNPTSQVSNQNISSINNDQSSAQTLIKFKLSEPLSSDDLDTKISSIRFKNIASADAANLSNQFEAFVIYDGSNFISSSSTEISTDEVILNFAEGNFNLVDDSSEEYELRAYLKQTGIIDGEKVKLELVGGAEGITTYASGSSFDSENSVAVTSPEHQISVVGTNLKFTSIPINSLIKNTSFSVSLEAGDINENIDLDATQNVELNLESGTGILNGVLANNLSAGQVDFNDLSYNSAENITLKATAIDYVSAISESISIISSQSSSVSLSDWTPDDLKISSLSNTDNTAIEVFRFTLEDKGDDAESTFLNTLRLLPGANNNVDWTDKIAGFIIKSGGTNLDANYVFDNSRLDINISNSEILREVSDGVSKEFSIHVYLRTELVDGEIFQMRIDRSHSGWVTSGSGLVNEFSGDLSGKEFLIDVEGTHLNFTSIPTDDVEFASNFEVTIKLTDIHGNRDSDGNQEVNLSLVDGIGNLTGTLVKNLISGEISFTDLSYNYNESIKLIVSGSSLQSVESDYIHVLASKSTNAQVQDWIPDNLFISSLSVSENDLQDVFRFQIIDAGDDQRATILKSIKLIAGVENTMNWQEDIAGFQLKINNEIVDANIQANESSLLIQFADLELLGQIQDGQSINSALSVYLNEKSSDGAIFQVALESDHSQWEVEGTNLQDNFTGNLEGKSFTVDVVGTELNFKDKPPKQILPNVTFEMSLKMIDIYGNMDLNSTKEAEVSLASGTGNLNSNLGLTSQMSDGEFAWNDLKYNKAENFTILIEADGLQAILSDNISSLDANSTVIASALPIASKDLNPLLITPEEAEVVFKFDIRDEGTFDMAPCRISSMKFFNKLISSGLDWKKHVAGAVLLREGEILAKTTKIEKEYISFTSLDLEIENSSQVELELGIYFKKSLLPDHAKFQVEIRKDHEWKSSTTGSGLVDVFPESIISNLHQVEIEADRFIFVDCPTGVEEDQNFETSIAAVDAFQNIDIDKSSSVSLDSENGTLSQTGVVGNLVNGVLKIDDLNVKGNQSIKLIASGDLLFGTTEMYIQKANRVITDKFESQDLSDWENSNDWAISSYLPIEGVNSLKHNLTNASGESCIVKAVPEIKPGAESIYWEFIIKNSDWDPSSSNNFVFHLLMDSNKPELADNLYSVGVNLTGSDDKLALWKTDNESSDLLITSDFDWNEDETVAIKVEYNAKGGWLFYYNRLGSKNNWLKAGEATSEVSTELENWYTALQFNFATASRAGELWFDGLKLETYNTAPYLKTSEVYADSLLLNFSEDLNIVSSVRVENFKLEMSETIVGVSKVKSRDDRLLVLELDDKLLTGHYNLSINNIEDLDGQKSNQETIEFDFQEEAQLHDLVINEILADESPAEGLPEYEFIEIYNASDHLINVQDFKLKVGNTEKQLSNFELPSNGYLILCSNSAVEFYKEFGHTLGVSSFPSLTNAGTNISLESYNGVLLDEIKYSSDWYGDDSKNAGGWSLERIDGDNHSWQADNWRASTNEKGGTPGEINSINGDNPDNVAPVLVAFEIVETNSIQLFFSETLNMDQAFLAQNYSIDEGIGHPKSIVELENGKFALQLSFDVDFENNIQYHAVFSNALIDLAGNAIVEKEFEFFIADLPKQGDLVINEVLFNPYPNGADYVELLNVSDRIIDIKDLLIANRDDNYQLDQVYHLSEKSNLLAVNSYLLLTTDTANVKANYSYKNEEAFFEIKHMPSYRDDEGRVVILNNENEQIDDFAYDEAMHFSQLTSKEGVALERINPKKETNSNSNWISAAQSVDFGTPGMKNSSYDIDENEVSVVGFKQKIFSPDNDGVDDRLIINFDLEKSGYVANIRIYNSYGREIRRLASNLTLSTTDELFWDGLLASKERASIGVYVLYFELFHPDGDVKTYKKTCVLGGKFK